MITIDDPQDPRLDDYRHLTDASARRAIEMEGAAHGIFIAEGPVALEQLYASGLPIRSVLMTPSRAASMPPPPAGVPLLVAPRPVVAAVAGYDVHRGVLSAAERPRPSRPDDVVSTAQRVLVLEGVSDNENVGSLFRNAAALGIDALLLDPACTDPYYRRSIRVSSGWSIRLPHSRVTDTRQALEILSGRGFHTVALTPQVQADPVDVAALRGDLDDPVAYVVGAEGPGLGSRSIAACSAAVRIPMCSGVDSLNVATSLAVVAAFAAAHRGWS
uniref:Putative rRNA methylase n=1 Tax=uncultured bacterium A1Q1_fos_862 TaxID=1256590 RepID=L7VYM1_9BACT|nr:putative rRNA methylase [uncultured bacterium A1Q1_fos_862]